MITIYHNPRCSKSRETLQLLKEEGEDFKVVEYLKSPPSKEELAKVAQQLGMRPQEFIRKGEKLYKEKFSQQELTDEEWLTVLSANPILIERPIVVKEGKAILGRPPQTVKKLF